MPKPLVVDLDGTLLRTDMLVEGAVALFRQAPLLLLLIPYWLLQGKAVLKNKIAQAVAIDPASLPFNSEVVARVKAAREEGRRTILATASVKNQAQAIADHLGLFDEVIATENVNLSAERKRDALVERFGQGGFDYIGNSADDLAVWRAADQRLLVNVPQRVTTKASADKKPLWVYRDKTKSWRIWLRAARLKQWVKNFLIFVPLLASHQLHEPSMLAAGLLGFVLFGICASSVYLLNDLLDLPEDRQHATKKMRPIAAGDLPALSAALAIPILVITSFTLAALYLPPMFVATMAVYLIMTLAYSLFLKRQMLVDVLTLAMLYTLRVVAGTFLFELSLTFWMLAFSMFMFLSLALVKRFAELRNSRLSGFEGQTPGRAYYPDDLELISALGAASGYLSVLVLAMYIQDESTVNLYSMPQAIWLACPILLYWISRIWMLAHRGRVDEDPVLFAIRDRASIFCGGCFALVFWLAT